MIEQGASLPEPGTVSTIKVIAEAGQPIYVEWTTTEQYLAVEIYQLVGRFPTHSFCVYPTEKTRTTA